MVGLRPHYVNRRNVWSIVLVLLLCAAVITAPTAAQNPNPLPDPTLRAGATGDFRGDTLVFGPDSGTLAHNADDDQVVTRYADLTLANFVAEVTFLTPYEGEAVGWSHGFFFRDSAEAQLRLIFDNVGTWELTLLVGDEFTTLQTGTTEIVETDVNSPNIVRLAADGDEGLFSLNGEVIAELDLSAAPLPGDIAVGTGMYTDTEVSGAETLYEDFTIWSIGIMPTPVPTLTPVAATFRAIVGSNRGEIAIGGGEIWNYEGTEGERLNISVIADRPAGREGTTEERLEQNLLDTYLIIRDSTGEIIAENDDDEGVPEDDINITNSFVSLTLPRGGLYQIEVRSYADESGGEYTLFIERVRGTTPTEASPTPTSEGRG